MHRRSFGWHGQRHLAVVAGAGGVTWLWPEQPARFFGEADMVGMTGDARRLADDLCERFSFKTR